MLHKAAFARTAPQPPTAAAPAPAKAAAPSPAPAAAASSAPAAGAGGNQTVKVKDGDTLTKLAKQFGVGICDIAKASNLADPNIVNVGDTLTIPAPKAGVAPDDTSCLPPGGGAATAGCVVGGPDRLVIPQAGLTGELAAKFLNITIDSFAAANAAGLSAAGGAAGGAGASKNITAAQVAAMNLTGGSVMQVPVCPNSQCTISQGTVKQGDIFDKIAKAAGSTTGQILMLNPGIDRLNLQVGQTFTLPSDCKNLTSSSSTNTTAKATA